MTSALHHLHRLCRSQHRAAILLGVPVPIIAKGLKNDLDSDLTAQLNHLANVLLSELHERVLKQRYKDKLK